MVARKHIAIAGLLLVGCGSTADVDRPDKPELARAMPPDATPAQVRAFADLEDATGQHWTWIQEPTLRTPMHLSAERDQRSRDVIAGGEPRTRTIAFFEEHKALFRMRSPATELSLTRAYVDALGMTHTRFQQTVGDVPVAGREVLVHYDVAGRLTSIDADYVPDLGEIDTTPGLGPDEAVSRAKVELHVSDDAAPAARDAARLVVYAPAGSPSARLAYQARITAGATDGAAPAIWAVTVDAVTGAILHKYDDLQTIEGQGTDAAGKTLTFQVSAGTTSAFVLTDVSTGVTISTTTAKQKQIAPGTLITSATETSWDTGVTGAGAAVDAHVNAENVYAYYKSHHARNSIDGKGGPMTSTVHYGVAYDNAAWDGTGMLYGDGGTMFKVLSLGLDVVGHEFTHGVTAASSQLQYETQSGALNEAISDTFGAFIEHALVPDPVKNWTIAEVITKNGAPIRDMTKPESVDQPQPGHMSEYVDTQQDNGGVHINSGIINNASWLMTVGGTNPVSKIQVPFGIGWEKSERVWYRANTTYFKQTTNFGQAAQGLLQAGKDLSLTDNELAIIDCSFKAVGVSQGACSAITDPQLQPQSAGAASPAGAAGPATGAGPGAVGAGPTGAAAASDDGAPSSTARTTGAPLPSTHKRAVTVEESGCNSSSGAPDFGASIAVVAGLLGLRRRRRRS
jgi:MYXO-CTERM domain-containing protein